MQFFRSPKALKNLIILPPRQTNNHSNSDMIDWIQLNLLSYPQFCPTIINRTVFQCINENWLKQGSQKPGQTRRGWGLLVSLFFGVFKESPQKRSSNFLPPKNTSKPKVLHRHYLFGKPPSHFLSLTTAVNHRYYRDCPIALY